MENIQVTIAKNLYTIRKQRNLTLDRLSELTGVSKAMLAQIEKGKSNPTVTTLWKIANGLQVSFSTFMKEKAPVIKKVNISNMDPLIDDEGKYRVFPLFPYHQEKKFEIYVVELQPGCSYDGRSHLGEEFIIMKEGEVKVNVQGEVQQLRSGDGLQFLGESVHGYQNDSDDLASFFMLVYYPDPE
ncbi:helix-turn-helix domain-containing protein [Halobacillus hunanensis]|uniref:helix-turn-helix domain-containing protein n=1 Tax=Halobacillus hunanensis TaxID=578214 RepID=UPI0009A7034E|nr:XRE family transcriptional regulator [Halobacillus hunanensis]